MNCSTHALRLLASSAILLAGVLTAPARAAEIRAAVHGQGIVVHDASETLRDFCQWKDEKLYFTAPDGMSWELVTSISDPVIGNPGDGQFHAFDAEVVRDAITAVRYPLVRVSAQVFVLPFPRRAGLESAAGPGLILLSPGVRAIAVEQQHAEVTHELGHVVQYALMPDANTTAWARYRSLRGIVDAATYSPTSAHVDRPHEIFAEDFRALFGGALANYSGTIENPRLAHPLSVPGLGTMMLALAEEPVRASAIAVVSAVAHGDVTFARDGYGMAELDIFDVAGRRVATVLPTSNSAGCHWTWNGRDASGTRMITAVLLARARDGRGGVARLVHVR